MKGLTIYLILALRNLTRNPRRTALNVAAIALGLFALIVFQALKQGLHQEILGSTIGLDTGSIQICSSRVSSGLSLPAPLSLPADIISRIKDLLGKEIPYAPRLRLPALASGRGGTAPVILTGIDPKLESKITFISKRLKSGSYLTQGEIIIGAALANDLALKHGSILTLAIPTLSGRTINVQLKVEGIYETALTSFDRSHVYIDIAGLRRILNADDLTTSIVILTPPNEIDEIAARLRNRLKDVAAEVMTWDELAPDVKQIMDINDATMDILMLIVFSIVALGIVNTMTTIIFERFRELGVMVAVGTPPVGMVITIELESLFLAIFASAIGTAAALAVCYHLKVHGLDLTRFTSANQHMAMSHILRARVVGSDLLQANLISCATALIAALYPALKAARLRPVEALRHT